MIRICPMCSNIDVEELEALLPGEEIEEGCIGECGSEYTAYVNDELITAESLEDFVAQCKK